MPIIRIMNLRNTKPTEVYDFVCDRTSPVGNPPWEIRHNLTPQMERDFVCDKYDIYFYQKMNNPILPRGGVDNFKEYINKMIEAYRKYGVIRLFCWCAEKRCHTETIRNYILKQTEELW